MKLIYCPHCLDMRKISYEKTFCSCGKSFGEYRRNGKDARIGGSAVPFGMANPDIYDVVTTDREDHTAVRAWRMRNSPRIFSYD